MTIEDDLIAASNRVGAQGGSIGDYCVRPETYSELVREMNRPRNWLDVVRETLRSAFIKVGMWNAAERIDTFLWRYRWRVWPR